MSVLASIKDVLLALLPRLTYEELEIWEGGSASLVYLDLFQETDEERRRNVREALLAYCRMDTFAMVELFRYLQNLVSIQE